MATTAYHNQFTRYLDKSAQLFFYMVAQVIAVHNSLMLFNGDV